MPKEKVPDHFILGHAVKSCMTVISNDGELSEIEGLPAHMCRFFI